jgi:hypothetical protein
MLFTCPRLGPLRAALGVPVAAVADDLDDICEVIGAQATHLPATTHHTVILLILWIIWKSRNRKVFDDALTPPHQLSCMINTHCELWLHRLPKKLSSPPMEVWCANVCEALNPLV